MNYLVIILVALISIHRLYAHDIDLFEMSLYELTNMTVVSSGSLTKTKQRLVPANMTTITQEMIRDSGARNLDELLEIFVPNLQRLKSGGAGPHFGIRGIISDLDNKTLLLVNGIVMNHKTTYGTVSERHLALLGDIESIEVIRGPGSTMHGPGAINGVISIQTQLPENFQGQSLTLRQGVEEEFSLFEYQYGHQTQNDGHVFVNLGLSHYVGASPKDSPLVFSKDGGFFSAGQHITDPNLVNDMASQYSKPHHKIHLHYQRENFQTWLRSTRGSIAYSNSRHFIEAEGSLVDSGRSLEYHQITLSAENEYEISDKLAAKIQAGYDIFDIENNVFSVDLVEGDQNASAIRESELNLKTLFHYEPKYNHTMAFGMAYSREWFGERASLLSNDRAHLARTTVSEWAANTISVFGEYQWNLNDQWTMFFGSRSDHHTYTNWTNSPKFALVFSPQVEHQFKLMLNRGVRKSEDPELKRLHDINAEADIETIGFYELTHQWQVKERLSYQLSLFHYQHHILAFLPEVSRETRVGNATVNGIEVEFSHQCKEHVFTFSHGYTDLLHFDLKYPGLRNQVITSEPYGFGGDLANWAAHISKISGYWKVNPNWKFSGSLRYYWQFEGAKDYTNYNNTVLMAANRSQSDGRTSAFDSSVFLNAGAHYQYNDKTIVSLNFYNLLGLFDDELNKRNFYGRMAGYRIEAPAASVRLEAKF